MNNLMSNIYIGYIEEVIYKEGRPTLELRVRVPSVHGVARASSIPTEDLPLARPLIVPGTSINYANFEEYISNINKVYIIFEGGNLNKPMYLGAVGNDELYTIPNTDSGGGGGDASIYRAANKALFPTIGDDNTIYIANNTQKIYTWNGSEYVLNGSKDSTYIGETTPSNEDYTQWFKPVEVTGIEGIETLGIIEEVPEFDITSKEEEVVPEFDITVKEKEEVVPEFDITVKEEEEVPEFDITSI